MKLFLTIFFFHNIFCLNFIFFKECILFYWYLHGHPPLDYELHSLCLIEQYYYLCYSVFNCIVDVSHGYRYSFFYILYIYLIIIYLTHSYFMVLFFSFIIFIFYFSYLQYVHVHSPCWDDKSMAISNIPHWQWEISSLLFVLYFNKILQLPANAVIILLGFRH